MFIVPTRRCVLPASHDLRVVPALLGEGVPRGGRTAYLLGEDRCRHRAVTQRVASPALVTGGVEEDGGSGKPGGAGGVAPGDPTFGVETEGVDGCGEPAGQARGHA